jgi:hypothetical protein
MQHRKSSPMRNAIVQIQLKSSFSKLQVTRVGIETQFLTPTERLVLILEILFDSMPIRSIMGPTPPPPRHCLHITELKY